MAFGVKASGSRDQHPAALKMLSVLSRVGRQQQGTGVRRWGPRSAAQAGGEIKAIVAAPLEIRQRQAEWRRCAGLTAWLGISQRR